MKVKYQKPQSSLETAVYQLRESLIAISSFAPNSKGNELRAALMEISEEIEEWGCEDYTTVALKNAVYQVWNAADSEIKACEH